MPSVSSALPNHRLPWVGMSAAGHLAGGPDKKDLRTLRRTTSHHRGTLEKPPCLSELVVTKDIVDASRDSLRQRFLKHQNTLLQ